MGRMYSIQFNGVAVTAQQDLFEIQPGSNKPIMIHGIFISQSTELGDAQEEMFHLDIIRGHATSGSGGSSKTAIPLQPNSAAAGATCEVNNTTIASTGTPVTLHSEDFNIRSGFIFIPTPEMRIGASSANSTIVVRLTTTPSDSTTMSGTLYFEEIN